MSVRSTVLLKETRPLLGPWFLVTLAGVTPVLLPFSSYFSVSMISLVYQAGFWIGLPLLARFLRQSMGVLLTLRAFYHLLSTRLDELRY